MARGRQPEPAAEQPAAVSRHRPVSFRVSRSPGKKLLSEPLKEIHRCRAWAIEVFMNRLIIERRLSIAVTTGRR